MPTITFESEYQKSPIKHNFIAIWLIMAIVLPMMSFFTLAMFHSHDMNGKRGLLNIVFVGLKHFTKTQSIISTVLFLISYTIIFLLITNYVNKRLMVVKIDFDDETKKITVHRIKYNDKLISNTYDQEKLLYRTAKEQSDGVSAEKFKCIKLIYEEELVGRIFLDHFTWTKSTLTENMITELKQRIKATKRYY